MQWSLILLGITKDIEFIGFFFVDFGFDFVFKRSFSTKFRVFLVVVESHSFLNTLTENFFPLFCRHNESTRRLREIEKRFNIRVLSVRSLCASLFYNVLEKALISYVYPLSFGETAFLMKIDHENNLADIASILVALRTDLVKVVSGIRKCALESNCLVVTQELNHCRH